MAYNAVNGTLSPKPYSPSTGVPTDGRTYFYDVQKFFWRPFQNVQEVLSYLDTAISRTGHFSIVVNSGGTFNSTLSGFNAFTGGSYIEYWFKDGVLNTDLVQKTSSTSTTGPTGATGPAGPQGIPGPQGPAGGGTSAIATTSTLGVIKVGAGLTIDAAGLLATGGSPNAGQTEAQVKALITSGVGFTNVKAHGAIGDGVADDRAAIQSAIDYAAYNAGSPSKMIYMPHGRYKINGTLHLGYGDASFGNNGFTSLILFSFKSGYDSSFSGAKIIVNFDNAPAINIQGGLRSQVVGILLEGKNKVLEAYQYPYMKIESWYTRYTDNAGADGRMTSAPNIVDGIKRGHFGITIDAYSAVVADALEPWPVAPPYGYGKVKSSGIKVLDCTLKFFVAAIVDHPSDGDAGSGDSNGDFIEVKGCNIKQNKYGVSIGNTQSRQVNIIDNQLDINWKSITNRAHGRRHGRVNYVAMNHFSGYQALDIGDLSVNGPLVIDSNYAETLLKIGYFQGGGSNATSAQFRGNTWALSAMDGALDVIDYILEGDNVSFYGDLISAYVLDMKIGGEAYFENCQLNITMSGGYNGVGFDWNFANDLPFTLRANNHTISNYGNGRLIYGRGCFALIDGGKTVGGYRYPLFNEVNNGRTFTTLEKITHTYGLSGLRKDYLTRSRTKGFANLFNKVITGIRMTWDLGSGVEQPLHNSLMGPGDVLEVKDLNTSILITERTGNSFSGTFLNNWTKTAVNPDNTPKPEGYVLNFNTTTIINGTASFFWYNNNFAQSGEAISGVIGATTNVIDTLTFDLAAEDHNPAVVASRANLIVGRICNFWSYTGGSPENKTSKMLSGKVTAVTGTSVTMEASSMTGTLPTGTVVSLFNKNPNEDT